MVDVQGVKWYVYFMKENTRETSLRADADWGHTFGNDRFPRLVIGCQGHKDGQEFDVSTAVYGSGRSDIDGGDVYRTLSNQECWELWETIWQLDSAAGKAYRVGMEYLNDPAAPSYVVLGTGSTDVSSELPGYTS